MKRNSYAPFGESFAPTVIDGTGYTGHVMDQATGLTYMQQRYYDPQIGRFLSVDPVAVRESGDNFNRYAYAFSNPYKFTDPDGRDGGGGYATGLYTQSGPITNSPEVAQLGVGGTAALLLGGPALAYVGTTAIAVLADAYGGTLAGSIAINGPAIVTSTAIVAEGVAGASGTMSPSPVALTEGQAANLARFDKKLPASSTGTVVTQVGTGAKFTASVPGKVPGSQAIYQKTVDSNGKTSAYTKTTLSPEGDVIHVKDKLNGGGTQ